MSKPNKPYADFPLTANGNGQWSKKIQGQVFYFGVWADPQAALENYKKKADYLHFGLTPPEDCKTLGDVLDQFLEDKKSLAKSTYKSYVAVCDFIAAMGRHRAIDRITPLDLKKLSRELAEDVTPITHKGRLTVARMVFFFANEILDCNVKYRHALKSPPMRAIRQHREKVGEKLYEAAEIRKLIRNACPQLKSILYLGINCAFGPKDCINFPGADGGWHNYGRPKTGVKRRCPLWKETQKALMNVTWDRYRIAKEFKGLCEKCNVRCLGVYSLRRTFETVAKNAEVNQSVIDKIMGHERPDMSEVYNQKTFDKQLLRCTDFVRSWLQGKTTL